MNGSVKPAESTRRASPIWFRVIRVNSKQYGLLAMLWDCEYLPGTEGVVMHMNGDPDEARQTVQLAKGEAVAYFDGLVKNEHFVEA